MSGQKRSNGATVISPLLPDGDPEDGIPSEETTPEPVQPAPPAAAAPPAPPRAVKFPLGWLLENASYPVQYRAITEVARLADRLPPKGHDMPLASDRALTLAVTQGRDGTWHGSMLTAPRPGAKDFQGVGTIPAVRRLLEYGWNRDTPPLLCARRVLFRLLAEDDSPEFLYELRENHPLNEDLVRRGRAVLREAAAATLAQAGYEADPRLRGAARRILDRVAAYIRSPAAQKPFIRFGNQHALPSDAAPPSIYTLAMLAYMPLFRQEHYDSLERLYEHVTRPAPKLDPVQMWGGEIVPQPQLVLGDPLPTRNAGDADIPFTMHWLELMARIGFLKRNESWTKLYDRYLDCCDSQGVFRPSKGMGLTSGNPHVWHMYPLDERADPGVVDVTFRLGVIGRAAGRPIEVA